MTRMYLYLLQLTDAGHEVMRGEYRSCVIVRAKSSAAARKIVAENGCIDDSPTMWRSTKYSTLRKIGECTPGTRQTAEIVMAEDNAW